MAALTLYEKDVSNNPNYCLIFCHGLGAEYSDFLILETELIPHLSGRWRLILPSAPKQPVSINMGMVMPSWYDIFEMDLQQKEDDKGMRQSVSAISLIIEQQIESGIASDHIFLGGFSQGGVISLASLFLLSPNIAGILALSAYCPKSFLIDKSQNCPVFYGHGIEDDVIPYKQARESIYSALPEHTVTEKKYSMPHSVCMEEIADMVSWINQQI